MNQLTLDNNRFTYIAGDEKIIILDLNDYISNNSRIPFQSVDNISVPGIILSLLHDHRKICTETNEGSNEVNYLMLDVLLVAELIKEYKPFRVLELGCSNGILSYHIGCLLGRFVPESSFLCVCNSMGSESGNYWLDNISMIGDAPKLSFMASDYDDIHLEKDFFDIVYINGSEFFNEPGDLIDTALRVIKPEGVIIVYSDRQPLLENCFRLKFPNCDEYILQQDTCILKAAI